MQIKVDPKLNKLVRVYKTQERFENGDWYNEGRICSIGKDETGRMTGFGIDWKNPKNLGCGGPGEYKRLNELGEFTSNPNVVWEFDE